MTTVALLSNPRSTGNRARLPEVRDYCAAHPDIFHYEVEDASEIGKALSSIALVEPKVIVVNGGDGTVQATLTELYTGDYFDGSPPPIAVLPNGKTNLIALDLGGGSDPISALKHVVSIARADLAPHIVERQLISLSGGRANRPVLGMFLGGAFLAEIILFCRQKIYPLGLPNGLSHVLATMLGVIAVLLRAGGRFFPKRVLPMQISLSKQNPLSGRFALLIVTTLEKVLLNSQMGDGKSAKSGSMRMFAIDHDFPSLMRGGFATLTGKLGATPFNGVHFGSGESLEISSELSSVILDGEIFEAEEGRPLMLRSTQPVPFLRLAA